MVLNFSQQKGNRRGTIAVLGAVMMAFLIGMTAFAVDYGYVVKVRADMQRAADAAALAATQDLNPAADGSQDLDAVRATVRAFVANNLNDQSFQVTSADIEIGRYDPDTIYSQLALLNSGTFDTVRVTLRRDGSSNPSVPLFFAKILGTDSTAVTATAAAVLQKPSLLEVGANVLPFGISADAWDSRAAGEIWSVYGDGKVKDNNGNSVPGNWGTLDIGDDNNSTSDQNDQIANGLRQSDLDALYSDGRINQNTHIDAEQTVWLNADTGLSSGLKHSIEQIHGQFRIVPIYDRLGGTNGNGNGKGKGNGNGNGNNLEFRIVRWGVVMVIDSNWNGNANTWVRVQKDYNYESELRPKNSLSGPAGIEGAFTSPVLVR